MKVVLVGTDLMIGSRIAAAADSAAVPFVRVDEPREMPVLDADDLVLVDWAQRTPAWREALRDPQRTAGAGSPRIRLFGPHTDLDAHAEAAAAGLGPMLARSKLILALDTLIYDGR